jgi:hypothetical protein
MTARRVFRMLLILLVAGRSATAQGVIPDLGPIRSRVDTLSIAIAVIRSPEITRSLLNRICAETDAIWKPAGITFEWHDVPSNDPVPTSWLGVTFDARRLEEPRGQEALGWIPFTAQGPLRSIHLSPPGAEELLLRTPGVADRTSFARETLLGRALGRALSHELGHYFLRSKMHSPDGLMRAVRSSEDFFRVSRHGFEPTTEEQEAAALSARLERPTEVEP